MGNLGRFMQSLLTSYTVTKNRRSHRQGHLFQGRFKGLLVEDEGYGSMVSRYIHLNPVKIKSLAETEFDEGVRLLRTYRWSSYAPIAGFRKCPKWIKRHSILCRWGDRLRVQQDNYIVYVEKKRDRPLKH